MKHDRKEDGKKANETETERERKKRDDQSKTSEVKCTVMSS